MDKKLLLIGGGGHCKSVIDALFSNNQFSEIAIIDINSNIGKKILNVSIIGCDDDLIELFNSGYKYAFITLGSIGDSTRRLDLYKKIENIGFKIPYIIDKSAVISCESKIEEGVFIGKLCVINADSVIKTGAIINTGSIIEHDCYVGQFSHIASGAVLGGNVRIGDYTHIGSNSTVIQQINIGSNVLIGSGSLVLNDLKDNIKAYGSPCKEVNEK